MDIYIVVTYNLITFRSRLETSNDSEIDPFNLMQKKNGRYTSTNQHIVQK